MSVSNTVASQIPAKVRERGQGYFVGGVVDLDRVSPTMVEATVHGSADYEVDLDLDGRTLFVTCTCPYVDEFGTACKHIWAALLAAEPGGFGRSAPAYVRVQLDFLDSDDDFGGDEPYEPPFRPAPVVPPPKREKWTTQLDALRKAALPAADHYPSHTRPVERQLLYVVDAVPSEQARKLVLEIQLQEMKKNGEWGKPKPQGLQPAHLDTFVDPLDRQLVALLAGPERTDAYSAGYSSSYYSYGYGVPRYRLTGPVLDAVLPVLARTGRVRLRRDPKVSDLEPLTEDAGPPWELAVQVARDAKGKNWVVTGTLRRGDETMPLSKATLVVPGLVVWDGRFARLADGDSVAWAPALRTSRGITVPVAKGDELLGRLLAIPSLPRLELPNELRVAEEAGVPKPRLVVRQKKSEYGGYGPPMLVADLSFDYDGEVVPAKPPARGFFRAEGRRFILGTGRPNRQPTRVGSARLRPATAGMARSRSSNSPRRSQAGPGTGCPGVEDRGRGQTVPQGRGVRSPSRPARIGLTCPRPPTSTAGRSRSPTVGSPESRRIDGALDDGRSAWCPKNGSRSTACWPAWERSRGTRCGSPGPRSGCWTRSSRPARRSRSTSNSPGPATNSASSPGSPRPTRRPRSRGNCASTSGRAWAGFGSCGSSGSAAAWPTTWGSARRFRSSRCWRASGPARSSWSFPSRSSSIGSRRRPGSPRS